MDKSNDTNILMRKLAIYELRCRNVLHLMFKSLYFYCLYQKSLEKTIFYFAILKLVKPNITPRKLKQ